MNRKTLAAAVVVPLLLSVTAADAAPKRKRKPKPKPVCNLIVDAKGDATDTGGIGVKAPNDPNLDIVSADVASDATRLTVVIRVDKLDDSENSSHLGRQYVFGFTAFGKTVGVKGITGPAGESWHGDAGSGTVDKAKREIRVTVPLAKLNEGAKLPQPLKNGVKITNLTASTWRWVGKSNTTLGVVDRAVGTGPGYTLGAPSCVKVGA